MSYRMVRDDEDRADTIHGLQCELAQAEARAEAAEAQRDKLAAALRPLLKAHATYVAVIRSSVPSGSTEAERRFSEGEIRDSAQEASYEALAAISFDQLCAVDAALADLSSEPVAESGDGVAAWPDPFVFTYLNYRGEVAERRVRVLGVRFGSTEWHHEPQPLLRAIDLDKDAEREFAIRDILLASAAKGEKAEIARLQAEVARLRKLLSDIFMAYPQWRDAPKDSTQAKIVAVLREGRE